MLARMLLPLLGGATAVWNTALVFYQTVLLAGYAYAHVTTRWAGVRWQAAVHLSLLLLALACLPLGIPGNSHGPGGPGGWTPPPEGAPILWLLTVLSVSVGLPFFAIAATAPLLQHWLAGTGHAAVRDPYSLYAASNLGSLLALLGYPTLVEPYLALRHQSWLWSAGYGLLVLLTAACTASMLRARGRAAIPPAAARADDRAPAGAPVIGRRRRVRWTLLAAVPSSLMLSVTTYLSTDIAAIPLLWVIPLTLYLATFILVFGASVRVAAISHRLAVAGLPIVMLPLVLILLARANEPLAVVLPTQLLAFFVAALVCHGELARDRPPASQLTVFYLWMALGGALGGIATALIAPQVWTGVVEYPLALVLACLLTPASARRTRSRRARVLDVGLPAGLGVVAMTLVSALGVQGGGSGGSRAALVFGGLVLGAATFAGRPIRFGLALGVILLAGARYHGEEGRVLHAERTFFGIHRVTLDAAAGYHRLLHGTTLHGLQSLDPARRLEPLAYFAADGPIGQLFEALRPRLAASAVGVVGLGAGSLACHGDRGQRWTFYEIDPAVERIARDRRYFTYLHDCLPEVRVVLGDARLSLAAAPDHHHALLILDAYGSDAPPVHLLTREALRLYLRTLRPDGVLAFNLTNRHLELEPVLGHLAQDAGLVARIQDDTRVSPARRARGTLPSRWLVAARAPQHLGGLAGDGRWRKAATDAGRRVWTDDYSSLLGALRWR